jgi:tetratricopeptide (TPR) repeat protein
MAAHQAASMPPSGVLLCGSVPPLADSYYPRPETGPSLADRLRPGQVVALVHGTDTEVAPAVQGGTGKTQLAVEFAHAMWNSRAVEVLVWVTATSREAVVTGFAQAANAVDAGAPDEDAEAAAARFVAWMAHTRRPWALIIDDLAEPADLQDLWPGGAGGRILITTRTPVTAGGDTALRETALRETALRETVFGDRELTVIPVAGMSRREALSYLTARLTDFPDQRIEALDLGEDLEGLPLGLAQATAVMRTREQDCREYRAQLAERRPHMPAVDGVSPAVLATWSIAAECAHELPPAGLAWPTLVVAALLDHHGVPGDVLTSPAACSYITGRPSAGGAADQNIVRAAINNLAQAGLITIDPASAVRTVQLHASVQAAVRAYLPRADLEQVVLTAADALLETWPEDDESPPGQSPLGQGSLGQGSLGLSQPGLSQQGQGRAEPGQNQPGQSHLGQSQPGQNQPGQSQQGRAQLDRAQLDQALRDCTATLRAHDGGALWQPAAHPVLFRAGLSLEHARLTGAAIGYWKSMVATSTRQLGPAHAHAAVARERLAAAYEAAGRSADAIAAFQAVLADRERNSGPEHADTITARAHLAHAYTSAGAPAEAVALYERTVVDSNRTLGPGHPVTLDARAHLAQAYQAAGQPRAAITGYELLLAEADRLLGSGHPTTLTARSRLAAAYAANGQRREAIRQYERAVADSERIRGRDHPDAIAARASLASALRAAGRSKDAIAQYERVLADRERIQGPDHPDTIAACANLAYAYRSAGRLKDAIPLYERTLADRLRVAGPDHRDTLTARGNLAACYQQARRLTDAIPAYERALADSERMLGAGDMDTLTTRCNLATAYYSAGRLADAVTVLQRALADCENYLGPDHQMTQTVRENLDAATQA